jgi:hypothetical protein
MECPACNVSSPLAPIEYPADFGVIGTKNSIPLISVISSSSKQNDAPTYVSEGGVSKYHSAYNAGWRHRQAVSVPSVLLLFEYSCGN